MEQFWSKIFPNEKFVVEDKRLNLVDLLRKFLADNPNILIDVDMTSSYTHFFDMQDLKAKLPFTDLEENIRDNPVDFAGCLGLAITIIANAKNPYLEDSPIIRAAFYNLSHSISFYEVRADTVGKLVSLEGSVARVSVGRPLVTRGGFKCFKCNQMTFVVFEDGIFQTPNICSTPRCDNRVLEFDRSQATLSEYQRLRLSEKSSDHSGTIPKMLEMEVRGDLVNQCIPGDILRVVGIVKTVQIELTSAQKFANRGGRGGGRGGSGFRQESALHELYVLVQSMECLQTAREKSRLSRYGPGSAKGCSLLGFSPMQLQKPENRQATEISGEGSDNAALQQNSVCSSDNADEFSASELQWIRQLALSDNALYHLCANFSPQIFGQELVKMGLLLGLFGGSKMSKDNNSDGAASSNSTRTNIHVLLVGDAGMGKSRILRNCLDLSPRSVFVGGATSTTAGLTATVSRESTGTGQRQGTDLCVEAGALVLADSGLCCIDELDKAACDTHALLEAMEQQRVSLAKGGAVINLRARTTIFAAANPSAGKYHKKRSVSENIRMNPALLSRFDLIFLMVDTPDEDRDTAIGAHIAGFAHRPEISNQSNFYDVENLEQDREDSPTLSQLLHRKVQQVQQGRIPSPVDQFTPLLMRKYIDYARQFVHPVLSNDAARILQKFYLRSRAQSLNCGASGLPVTLRHLESIIRLAQARARVDLRDEVSGRDAKEVVMLWTEAIKDGEMIDGSTGQPVRVFGGGEESGRRGGRLGAVRKLTEALQREAGRRPPNGNASIFSLKEISLIVQRLGLDKSADEIIESLRNEGRMIKKGPHVYQLV